MFILNYVTGFAQKITRVNLVQSESFIGMKVNGKNTQKVIKPVFTQDNATLICDSALFYIEKNSFDAFGNVHINQADTINIYSDLLNYDGNTKRAILKNNVRMIDKDAILTTNDFDYNMQTKIGNYYNGGKIVNGENTLTSINGYYFSNSRDAYFRYNVKVKSPDVVILSDTLKYNTQTKIAYFFGPTNIYGKEDTLYTENGQYNTLTDQAAFGKKNLYRQGAKSLKGDSLFYDGKAGYGRAVKNILFKDTAQKIELRGDLGIYLKKGESIEVTKNAFVVIETEKDSLLKDSMYITADTLKSRVLPKKDLYTLRTKNEELNIALLAAIEKKIDYNDSPKSVTQTQSPFEKQTDSLKTKPLKDSLILKKLIKTDSVLVQKPKPILPKQNPKPGPINIALVVLAPQIKSIIPKLEILDNKKLGIRALEIKSPKNLIAVKPPLPPDARDTTKIRILSAYKKVKIFKSDLQAVADSAFFSYGDSCLRIYQKPMLWAQGSQIAADTMYLQMKHKKVDNMDLIKNAIIVNTEKDSLNFNQIAGKKMKGFFVKDKLDRVFVDGNAESIYFPQDSSQKGNMLRTIASRMRVMFAKDSLKSILWIRKPEVKVYPKEKLTEELKTLANFSWKPKDRPISKEQIIPSLSKTIVKQSQKKKKTPVIIKPKPKPKVAVKRQSIFG